MLVQLDLTNSDVQNMRGGLIKEAARLTNLLKKYRKNGTADWLIKHTDRKRDELVLMYNQLAEVAAKIIAAEQ